MRANRGHPGLTQLCASPSKVLYVITLSCVLLGACDNDDNDNNQSPTTSAVPSRSSTIGLTSDGKRLVVVNRQNDTVSVIEVRSNSGEDTQNLIAEIPVGKEPRYVTISPDNRTAYVSNAVDGTLSVIDLAAATPAIVRSATRTTWQVRPPLSKKPRTANGR